jgi:aminoglycoside phosphotransferase family enzyme
MRDKVAFLGRPGSFPVATGSVTVVETHHAWVFLTDTLAYKMKKPFRRGGHDYSGLGAREQLCREEIRLNRVLAADTYITVVPLVLDDQRELRLEGRGRIVEWLVKMRRLPAERMLDVAATRGRVARQDIRLFMRKLLRFYRRAPPCRVADEDYPGRLLADTRELYARLLLPAFRFDAARVDLLAERQAACIDAHASSLGNRARGGCIREIHGDLRPEHVCLVPGTEPEIIDRLEFDRDLRCLDPVEELAFFGVECRAAGYAWIETECTRLYRERADDDPPAYLWDFYAARRAMIRAWLAAGHTLDGDHRAAWLRRGRDYLGLALDYTEGLAAGGSVSPSGQQ